jgi:hypothetical protein
LEGAKKFSGKKEQKKEKSKAYTDYTLCSIQILLWRRWRDMKPPRSARAKPHRYPFLALPCDSQKFQESPFPANKKAPTSGAFFISGKRGTYIDYSPDIIDYSDGVCSALHNPTKPITAPPP